MGFESKAPQSHRPTSRPSSQAGGQAAASPESLSGKKGEAQTAAIIPAANVQTRRTRTATAETVAPVTSIPPAPNSAASQDNPPEDKPNDPTRYGDWEKKGRCIDF